MNWRKQTECFFNFADALTPGVIHVECVHGRTAHGCQSFDFVAFEPEVFRPKLPDRVK